MSVGLPFSKYHGLGNDFLVLDARARDPRLPPEAVVALCDRHRGVGADGVLTVLPDPGADLRMRVQNADGSEAETCGNGLRCVAWHAVRAFDGFEAGRPFTLATGAGIAPVEVLGGDAVEARVRVGMGAARPGGALRLDVEGRNVPLLPVSMGNPHAVIFDPALVEEAARLGPAIERHAVFPQGTNVGFARVTGPSALDLTVWERGCGFTEACGSGACAATVAGVISGRFELGRPVAVRLPGGTLEIEVAADLSQVWMTGDAAWVFDGLLAPGRFGGL